MVEIADGRYTTATDRQASKAKNAPLDTPAFTLSNSTRKVSGESILSLFFFKLTQTFLLQNRMMMTKRGDK
jgi:hypothetical protein